MDLNGIQNQANYQGIRLDALQNNNLIRSEDIGSRILRLPAYPTENTINTQSTDLNIQSLPQLGFQSPWSQLLNPTQLLQSIYAGIQELSQKISIFLRLQPNQPTSLIQPAVADVLNVPAAEGAQMRPVIYESPQSTPAESRKESFLDKVKELWSKGKKVYDGVKDVWTQGKKVWGSVKDEFGKVGEYLQPAWDGTKNFFSGIGGAIRSGWNWFTGLF